jgi:hypothetical protein
MSLFIFIFSQSLLAASIDAETLISYTDKNYHYSNKDKLKQDKMFSASKFYDQDVKPRLALSAYKGPKTFKQLALVCSQCRTKETTPELNEFCRAEYKKLYKHIFGQDLSAERFEKLQAPPEQTKIYVKAPQTEPQIRVVSGFDKCDGKSGKTIRIDTFIR